MNVRTPNRRGRSIGGAALTCLPSGRLILKRREPRGFGGAEPWQQADIACRSLVIRLDIPLPLEVVYLTESDVSSSPPAHRIRYSFRQVLV